MVSFHEPEVSEWHSSGELPALAGSEESALQLLHQVEEAVFVGEGASAVSSAGVLPVEVQTIEVVFLQEVCEFSMKIKTNVIYGFFSSALLLDRHT